jgi:hypothetical protein
MSSARLKIGLWHVTETAILRDIDRNSQHGKTRLKYHAPHMKAGANLIYGFYFSCPKSMEDEWEENTNSLGGILVHKH